MPVLMTLGPSVALMPTSPVSGAIPATSIGRRAWVRACGRVPSRSGGSQAPRSAVLARNMDFIVLLPCKLVGVDALAVPHLDGSRKLVGGGDGGEGVGKSLHDHGEHAFRHQVDDVLEDARGRG